MTHIEIFQTIEGLVPAELLRRYEHLCYGEMAEIPELTQWAADLRWAEDEWARADSSEGLFS